MRRGTTPTHIFTLPFDVDIVSDVRVIYEQNNEIIFKKTLKDCSLEGNTITLKLTREETFHLAELKFVNIQMEVWTQGGDVLVSNIMKKAVDECLDDEV